MSTGFKDKNKKFHPIKKHRGVRRARDNSSKHLGVKISRNPKVSSQQLQGAPEKIKICSTCERSFDIDKVPQDSFFSLPQCAVCKENDVPPLGSREKSEPFKVQKTKGATEQELVQMQRADVGRRALDMGMSKKEMMEWEHVAGSDIVKVKHEMMNGKPVTTVRFANGEEWFEFDDISHQEEFIKMNDIEIDHDKVGEFIEIDHPMIAGYVTMPSGKIAFGEREDSRKKRIPIFNKVFETKDQTVWQDQNNPSMKVTLRWNPVTSKWQLFRTDGTVEVEDYGKFTDKNKDQAIKIAEREIMRLEDEQTA